MLEPQHPPIPPVSRRSRPRFASQERRDELAAAFADQGEDYDRLRPGYPRPVVDAILARSAAGAEAGVATGDGVTPRVAVDLGAGTGKLTLALAGRGLQVTAVDTSAAMLAVIERAAGAGCGGPAGIALADAAGPVLTPRTVQASAEDTGLPAASADLVTSAQAWHWFDHDLATAEVLRLLRPGGVLALVWNSLDVAIPWVHRLSRIMHAGDVLRDDFTPAVGPGLELVERTVHRWQDPLPTPDLIDLARTRSYVITAAEERRRKVLANLDWYLHEHLGHARGTVVGLPYRTDLFLYRADGE